MYNRLNLKENEGFFLTDRVYRRYFSGIDVEEGSILIFKKGIVYFSDARYFYAVKEKLSKSNIECVLFEGMKSIKTYIENEGLETIYLDYDSTTLTENEVYKGFGVSLQNGSSKLKALCEIKTENEIKNIKKACEIIEKAVNKAFSILKTGITEKAVEKFIIDEVLSSGAEGMSFNTIVAFGKNSAVPHHETDDTELFENQAVLIDAGCIVNGYCSDITRTAFYGTPDEEFLQCYEHVKNANLLCFDTIKEGYPLKSADAAARDYLSKAGIGKYFTHSLGHGVGTRIHEEPRLSTSAEGTFKENMVFTIEPGVYFDGKFGIRIEDTAVLQNNTARRLFSDSKNLRIINIK